PNGTVPLMASIRTSDGALVVYHRAGEEWFLSEASTSGPITWTHRTVVGPAYPDDFYAIYAYASGRDEIFKLTSSTVQSFVPGGQWISRATIDYPRATSVSGGSPPLAYDPGRDEVYFVQDSSEDPSAPNEVWVRKTTDPRWSRIEIAGPSPAPRFLHQ